MDALHFLCWWYLELFRFLKHNEWIALWIEGIALVAIFWYDRRDAQADHEETVEQLRLTRQQIGISRKQVEASENAERAWLTTELLWEDVNSAEEEINELKVYRSTANGQTMTHVLMRLNCFNTGRSPAWIDAITGYAEVVNELANVTNHEEHDLKFLGWMQLLGPGTSRFKNLILEADGDLGSNNLMALYVKVFYHDIHGHARYTSCGYIVRIYGQSIDLRRHDEKPERNESV
jgi:hypothetical protein